MNVLMTRDYSSLPEGELLTRARDGNEEAFTEIVHRNYRMIYKISKRVLGNHEDAEDTLQNVLVRVLKRLDGFDGNSRFSTWLYRVTFNEALMMLRRNRSRGQDRSVELSEVQSGGGVADLQDPQENNERNYMNRELARKALLGLNPTLRSAFLLHEGEGCSHRELTKKLGISVETAKSRVFRARRQLREELAVLTR